MRRLTLRSFILGAILALLISGNAVAETSETSLKETIEFLSGLDSRIPGYEGNVKARDYIYEAFNQSGLQNVQQEEFFVTVPVDKGARLLRFARNDRRGEEIKLYSLWPNMVKTSSLPPEGISGKLIYAGAGEYEDYNGADPGQAIVALEFNSGTNWLKAASLGAKAIIFIEPLDTMRIEAERKFVEVPVNVPRYMLPRENIKLLEKMQGETITLKAGMDWEKAKAWNIYGFIPGKNEELSEELIAISAYYDSMSVVPGKAPGAEARTSPERSRGGRPRPSRTRGPPPRPVAWRPRVSRTQPFR